MPSVLQDWVMDLPLRFQGTLLTGIRSCDTSPKHPPTTIEKWGCSTGECSPDRQLVAFLRYCILNPADHREINVPGAWFQTTPPEEWKPSQLGHYPQHWYSHLMHCYEIVSYEHPRLGIRIRATEVYERLVRNMHLNPETQQQLWDRLTEDRIATGEIVS